MKIIYFFAQLALEIYGFLKAVILRTSVGSEQQEKFASDGLFASAYKANRLADELMSKDVPTWEYYTLTPC